MSTQQTNPSEPPEIAVDLGELMSATASTGDSATPQERAAESTSAALGKQYHPSQVPYLNDSYTFADREEELRLLQSLLSFRMSVVTAELTQVVEINRTRAYPNIAFQSQTPEAAGKE